MNKLTPKMTTVFIYNEAVVFLLKRTLVIDTFLESRSMGA